MRANLLGFILISIYSCSSDKNSNEGVERDIQTTNDPVVVQVDSSGLIGEIEYRVFRTDTVLENDATGWGYDIYVDQKRMIHQPHVPAISGNVPFQSKEMAESVAKLVIFKLSNDINPPSVSINELDSLGFE